MMLPYVKLLQPFEHDSANIAVANALHPHVARRLGSLNSGQR